MLILVVTPFYLSRLGVDGYAIIGFWIMLQFIMGFLEFGIGPTIIREFASADLSDNSVRIKTLLKSLEAIYFLGSLLIALVFIFSAKWISLSWLKVDPLHQDDMVNIIRIMGLSLSFQFPFSLYSNGMLGLQKHRIMNYFQLLASTLRYGAGALVLLWRPDVAWFFIAQIIVSAGIIILIRRNLWSAITLDQWTSIELNFKFLNEVKKFTLAMGINSLIAVLIASSDRLILSRMVSTYEFGAYAIAFTATGLLQLGIQPFYRVYFPRYSELSLHNNYTKLRNEYFKSCQLIASVIIPISLAGFFFADQILVAWLGYGYPVTTTKIFQLLLIGICCSGLGWLPAAMQQSQGLAKLHIYMMLCALIIGIPITIYAIDMFGAVGGVTIWIVHGAIEITFGLWLMHKKFFVGELLNWYREVLLPPLLIGLTIILSSIYLLPNEGGRLLIGILSIGIGCLGSALAISYHFRCELLKFCKRI